METNTIVPPNLNALFYRNFRPPKEVFHRFLDFVDINKEGQMLIGSSALNSRYWNGSVHFFANYSDKCVAENIKISKCLSYGVTDGKFLNENNKFIVSQDSGDLTLLEITEHDNLDIEEICFVKEHGNQITEISLWPNKTNFVTSSLDESVRVWTVTENNITLVHSFEETHFDIVSSVSANPSDNHVFASCSYDKNTLLWDTRTENLKKVIYENEFCALTKVEWHPTKSHIVVIGTSSGDIYLVDVREPMEFVAKNSCFKRSIHKTSFNSNSLLAVCADDTAVKIFDCTSDDLKLIYVNDQHSDFVRGLTWTNETCVSCGWDQQIYLHNP